MDGVTICSPAIGKDGSVYFTYSNLIIDVTNLSSEFQTYVGVYKNGMIKSSKNYLRNISLSSLAIGSDQSVYFTYNDGKKLPSSGLAVYKNNSIKLSNAVKGSSSSSPSIGSNGSVYFITNLFDDNGATDKSVINVYK